MIKFNNIYKKLNNREILSGVDFLINTGEVIAIVGQSGAGKSVTLKHMVRLMSPDRGSIEIDGERIDNLNNSELRKKRSKIGVLFQSSALIQWLSVYENIALPLYQRTSKTKDEIYKIVSERLKWVDLLESKDLYPSELSGGMQKRVGLARATILDPKIILYDEPTSGLDPVTSRKIDKLIMKLNNEMQLTSVIITHDLISALSISSKIMMLHDGKIIEFCNPNDFIKSNHPVVQKFVNYQKIL
ncbi:MAG: ATP-binding cassette domain-containing protein [Verrucomicrobiota bacterium]|nr:ATP-binding cassette domain-containing protein [Verrucomicrobiota bacterium]